MVVGTKIDLDEERAVTTDEAQNMCEEYEVPLFETSSKLGVNVQEVFTDLAESLLKQMQNAEEREPLISEVLHDQKLTKSKPKKVRSGWGSALGNMFKSLENDIKRVTAQKKPKKDQKPAPAPAPAPTPQRSQKTLLKIVIIGSEKTGKTSIMNKYIRDKFSERYSPTIGADFLTREEQISGQIAVGQFWDTAGQERFSSLGCAFYRGSDACIIVFDVTNRESFERLDTLRDEFIVSHGDTDGLPFVLMANQIDRSDERVVSEEEAKSYAEHINATYVEVSAKTGHNIHSTCTSLMAKCLDRLSDEAEVGGIQIMQLE